MLDAILVFVPVTLMLWAKYVLPIGIAGGIVCMSGRGIWYLLRKDLYDELDRQQEVIGNQTQQLAWLFRERKKIKTTITRLKTDRSHLEREHQRALEKARNNASNTGLFKGYTGPMNAPTASANKPTPPPLPVRKRQAPPPPPRRATPPLS